jgi:hypothetical protein
MWENRESKKFEQEWEAIRMERRKRMRWKGSNSISWNPDSVIQIISSHVLSLVFLLIVVCVGILNNALS